MEQLRDRKPWIVTLSIILLVLVVMGGAALARCPAPFDGYRTSYTSDFGISYAEPDGWEKHSEGDNSVQYTDDRTGAVLSIVKDDLSDVYGAYETGDENPSAVLLSTIVGEMGVYNARIESSVYIDKSTRGKAIVKFKYRNAPGVGLAEDDGIITLFDLGRGEVVFLNMKYDDYSISDKNMEYLESLYNRIETHIKRGNIRDLS